MKKLLLIISLIMSSASSLYSAAQDAIHANAHIYAEALRELHEAEASFTAILRKKIEINNDGLIRINDPQFLAAAKRAFIARQREAQLRPQF